MQKGKVILQEERFKLTLERLAQEIIERHGDLSNCCIIGIQEKGVVLAERIISLIKQRKKSTDITFGKLDITFYRDDFRTREMPIKATSTEIEFLLDGMEVILVDDVLYTGRTIQSALSALQDYGRPSKVHLMVMVDRRFNRHLPIQPDFTGLVVDSLDKAYVKVLHKEIDDKDQVLLFPLKD